MQFLRKTALARTALVSALALVAIATASATAGAQSFTGAIGGPGFSQYTVYHSAGPGSSEFTFINGEYYQQQFSNTGLTSAQALDVTLNLEGNPYGTQIFTAFLNGTSVGTYSVGDQFGPTSYSWTFAPVAGNGTAGQDFRLVLKQTGPTLPPGGGSSAFLFDQSSATLTQTVTQTVTTPEPGSLALLGTGLVGLVPMVRRKKMRA